MYDDLTADELLDLARLAMDVMRGRSGIRQVMDEIDAETLFDIQQHLAKEFDDWFAGRAAC